MHPRARREDAKSRSVEGDASGESAPSQVWEFFCNFSRKYAHFGVFASFWGVKRFCRPSILIGGSPPRPVSEIDVSGSSSSR